MADPDVQTRSAVKVSGEEYYKCILVHDDDILCVSKDPNRPMGDASKVLRFKNDEIDDPGFYLGVRLKRKNMTDGRTIWTMTSANYSQRTVRLLMHNCIDKLMQRFQHKAPNKPTHSPHPHQKPSCGSKQQFAPTPYNFPAASEQTKTKLQAITGALLHYARAVDNKLLVALGSIATKFTPQQKKPKP